MSKKRWSSLVFGYGLILLVTVMLGAFTIPMSAMADGAGGTIIPPAPIDSTATGSSINNPIDTEISPLDLLLITIDSMMMV